MEKRGQITLFVILGILLLIFTSIGFHLYGQRINKIDEIPIPPEIEPVASYIKLCMNDYGVRAANTIGLQGGYITFPPEINLNPWAYIEYLPDSGIKLPYWYYKSKNRWPSIPEMEADISNFINSHLRGCISNFSGFKGQFDVKETGEMKATTMLTDEDVVIKLEYPLQINNLESNKVTDFSTFITHVPVRIKKVYELARNIIEKENQGMFMEDVVLNLMVLNPDIPFSDMQFKCGTLKWRVAEIVDSLKETLFWNMPRVRVDKTDYVPFKRPLDEYTKYDKYDKIYVPQLEEYVRPVFHGDDVTDFSNLPTLDNLPEDMYEYKQMFWKDVVDNNDFKEMQVNFVFDRDWDLRLRATPSSNGVLKSSEGKGASKYLSYLCLNIFHFTYDVEFPVEVNVFDSKSFNGEGYNFKFATPVMIKSNLPDKTSTGVTSIVHRDRDAEVCENLGDVNYELRARDVVNKEWLPLPGQSPVNFTFECGRFECPLGSSKLEGLFYQVTTPLPKTCGPGRIVAEAEGYLKGEKIVPGLPETRVQVELTPLVPLKLNVKRFESININKPLELKDTQKVTVQLYNEELDYTVNEIVTNSLNPVIKLPYKDVSYEVNLILTEEDKDGKFQMTGGYKVDNLTIDASEFLDGAIGVTFNVYEKVPMPVSQELRFEMFTELESQDIKDKLAPVFR